MTDSKPSGAIMAWGDYGPDSITGQWSANTYDREDAVEYVPAGSIWIKPLIWELSNARSIVGTYNIGRIGGEWWVRLRDCEIAEGHAPSFEAAEIAAKAAAQSDHDARVRSVLVLDARAALAALVQP